MRYTFECKECKKFFEISATIEVFVADNFVCPHCGSRKLKRSYTSPNIIFNGKGFYKTDNRKEKI